MEDIYFNIISTFMEKHGGKKIAKLWNSDKNKKKFNKIFKSEVKSFDDLKSIDRNKNEDKMNWFDIISNNKYIRTQTFSCLDEHSFCSLVEAQLTQSENIRLGIAMEHLFKDAISLNTSKWIKLEEKLKKGDQQKDHIWINKDIGRIIYAEQKNNITLDTEKSKKTVDKIKTIAKSYPNYDIKTYLLAARYLSKDEELLKQRLKKFPGIEIIGINDFLNIFGITGFKDYDEYKIVINKVVKTKFGK
jgi:hypothetical protein